MMVRLLFHRKILIPIQVQILAQVQILVPDPIQVPIPVPALIPDQVPTQALAQTQDPVLIQALYLMR